MPLASASAPQLDLFISDSAAYEAALARYEALRPVLTGERSLRQQSAHTGINYWRLWRDRRRFQREGLLGLLDQRTVPHPRRRWLRCSPIRCCRSGSRIPTRVMLLSAIVNQPVNHPPNG